jgi:PST family polysaccharide transporter
MGQIAKASLFNFIIKLFFTISIFIFIHVETDYVLVPLVYSIGQILAGGIAFVYVLKKNILPLKLPTLNEIIQQLKGGWIFFSSTVIINLYTTSNILILGLWAANYNLGIFSAAQKIIIIIQSVLLLPLNQTLFPYIGKLMHTSYEDAIHKLKLITTLVSIISFISSTLLYVFAPLILHIVFGDKFTAAITCLRLMSFLPFIIGMSNLFSIQGLLNMRKDREFLLITIGGAIINIIFNFFFAQKYLQDGTAVAWVFAEIFIAASSYYILLRNGVNLIDLKLTWRFLKRGEYV